MALVSLIEIVYPNSSGGCGDGGNDGIRFCARSNAWNFEGGPSEEQRRAGDFPAQMLTLRRHPTEPGEESPPNERPATTQRPIRFESNQIVARSTPVHRHAATRSCSQLGLFRLYWLDARSARLGLAAVVVRGAARQTIRLRPRQAASLFKSNRRRAPRAGLGETLLVSNGFGSVRLDSIRHRHRCCAKSQFGVVSNSSLHPLAVWDGPLLS